MRHQVCEGNDAEEELEQENKRPLKTRGKTNTKNTKYSYAKRSDENSSHWLHNKLATETETQN